MLLHILIKCYYFIHTLNNYIIAGGHVESLTSLNPTTKTDTSNHVETLAPIHPEGSPDDPFLHYGCACRLLSPRACPATCCYLFQLTQLHF